jgi:hypothetical protein
LHPLILPGWLQWEDMGAMEYIGIAHWSLKWKNSKSFKKALTCVELQRLFSVELMQYCTFFLLVQVWYRIEQLNPALLPLFFRKSKKNILPKSRACISAKPLQILMKTIPLCRSRVVWFLRFRAPSPTTYFWAKHKNYCFVKFFRMLSPIFRYGFSIQIDDCQTLI